MVLAEDGFWWLRLGLRVAMTVCGWLGLRVGGLKMAIDGGAYGLEWVGSRAAQLYRTCAVSWGYFFSFFQRCLNEYYSSFMLKAAW